MMDLSRAFPLACAFLLAACSPPESTNAVVTDPPQQVAEPAGRPDDPTDWPAHLDYFKVLDAIEDPVERCLAFPDLPGSAWPAGSVAARCAILAGSPFSARGLEDTLSAGGAGALDALFADALERHYADTEQAELHFAPYFALGEGRRGGQVARRWRRASPDSPFALLAMAQQQMIAIGSAIREPGAGDSPRVVAMIENFRQVLREEPRLTFACIKLIEISISLKDASLGDEAEAHCLEHNPYSWNVNDAVLRRYDPRNDGDPAGLAKASERLRGLSQAHPALASLAARDIGLAGLGPNREGDYNAALLAFEEAARLSPDPFFIGLAGRVHLVQGDSPRAAYLASQALRLAPMNLDFRAVRAMARQRMGDFHGAIDDSRVVIASSSNPDASYFVVYGTSLWEVGRREESREVFAYTMRFPDRRRWAFWRLCETWIRGMRVGEEGLECTEHLVGEYPRDPESLFLRAWALHETGDERTRSYVERFRHVHDSTDNRQIAMLSELRRVGAPGSE